MPLSGPYLVDPGGSKWGLSPNPPGPHEYNGALYVFWRDVNADVGIWKSTDGLVGATWTKLTAGQGTPGNITALYSARVSATEVRMAYRTNVGGTYYYHIASFSFLTETLTDIVSSAAQTFNDDLLGYEWQPAGSQDWLYAYKYINANTTQLQLWRYDGSWLATIDIAGTGAGRSPHFTALTLDPDGNTHIIYVDQSGSYPPYPYISYYRQIHPDGTLTAAISVHTAGQGRPLWGHPSILGTKIIWPYRQESSPTGFYYFTASFFVSDPYTSASPTFTRVNIPQSERIAEIQSTLIDGHVEIWWIENLTIAGDDLDRTVRIQYDGASLSSYEVLHDEIANPSFPAVGFQFMHDLAPAVQLSDGSVIVHIALEYPDPITGFTFCTGFMWTLPAVVLAALRSRAFYRKPFFCPR